MLRSFIVGIAMAILTMVAPVNAQQCGSLEEVLAKMHFDKKAHAHSVIMFDVQPVGDPKKKTRYVVFVNKYSELGLMVQDHETKIACRVGIGVGLNIDYKTLQQLKRSEPTFWED